MILRGSTLKGKGVIENATANDRTMISDAFKEIGRKALHGLQLEPK